jgi:hypothetical protein
MGSWGNNDKFEASTSNLSHTIDKARTIITVLST